MGSYNSWEYYKAMDPRPISTVALKAGLKEKIVNGKHLYWVQKDIYLHICWRYGAFPPQKTLVQDTWCPI